jgi:hypothetical protein
MLISCLFQEDDLVASVRQKYVKAAPPPVNNATESPRRGRKSSTTKAVRSRTSSVPASKMEVIQGIAVCCVACA